MHIYPTDKVVAAVRLETCLQDENGDPSEYGLERFRELKAEGRFLIVVSPKMQTLDGLRYVYDFLARNGVEYDDVWAGSGIPLTQEWYDALTEAW